ncbi:MAG TPA: SulP family inorganic anion transporter [Cyclobacteriaceae bacterium]
MTKQFYSHLDKDIPSGIVVFLVALPLCLGIALASGAPLFAGVIAGIVGGLVVGAASGSQLSVSGPAAGLTVIVLSAIERMGSYELFIASVAIAGLIQLAMGFLKAGIVGHYFPSTVIKGMLAAIGLILILKQIPHALGDDRDYEGDESFYQPDGENTFTEIILAIQNTHFGAITICLIALAILILWERPFMKRIKLFQYIPGPLIAVLSGVLLNELAFKSNTNLYLSGDHLVTLPVTNSLNEFIQVFTLPDFSKILTKDLWITSFTIAIIASLETLLSLDAVDKLDPHKRIAPTNRELKAQGLGNFISGMIGGLPLTAVIVRSSANVASGAQTKFSAIFHGVLLLTSVAFFPQIMNLIPLASLAAVLLVVGFKLTKPKLYKTAFEQGMSQFVPFIVTIIAILFTDLLIGITIGILTGVYFVIKTNLHKAISVHKNDQQEYTIQLNKDVSFLNKAFLRNSLQNVPAGSKVIFDGSKAIFVDHDIVETILDFQETSESNDIEVEVIGSTESDHPIFANM